jgi:Mrp family chromosome partitioning ATPase
MSNQSPSPKDQLALTTRSVRAECDSRLVSLLQPDSSEAEQFRCLRYSLLRTLQGGRCNVIGVSSPCNGNGKTTTAINLAAALEEPGIFRVLLVDADLRTASIADRLALEAVTDDGLDTALANWSLGLRDIVRRFPQPYGFGVLPTAARPDIAGRLVASPRFGMLIEEAREHYDFVVVDTPPLVPAADCRAMAPWIDGFVVVVAAHKTPRKVLEEALNAMRQDQILGLVFSGDDGSPWFPRGGYHVGD